MKRIVRGAVKDALRISAVEQFVQEGERAEIGLDPPEGANHLGNTIHPEQSDRGQEDVSGRPGGGAGILPCCRFRRRQLGPFR